MMIILFEASNYLPLTNQKPRTKPLAMSMPPQQKEDYETAINDLQWLSIQNSSEDETSSPLMQLSSASSSSSSLTDYSSHMYRSRPQSPSSSPSRPSRKLGKCVEYGVKNARDALVGSISAVINFLRISGVPKPRCVRLVSVDSY